MASPQVRDRIAGAVLLAVSLIWIALVFVTIEPDQGAAAGSRTFPLAFGIFLALLSLIMLGQAFLGSAAAEEPDAESAAPGETLSAAVTFGILIVYGFLLQPLGFILSTTLIVAAIMIIFMRIRSPFLIAAMALGLAVGCYLVFGKLLGTYLPPGTLYPIYF